MVGGCGLRGAPPPPEACWCREVVGVPQGGCQPWEGSWGAKAGGYGALRPLTGTLQPCMVLYGWVRGAKATCWDPTARYGSLRLPTGTLQPPTGTLQQGMGPYSCLLGPYSYVQGPTAAYQNPTAAYQNPTARYGSLWPPTRTLQPPRGTLRLGMGPYSWLWGPTAVYGALWPPTGTLRLGTGLYGRLLGPYGQVWVPMATYWDPTAGYRAPQLCMGPYSWLQGSCDRGHPLVLLPPQP